jgi:hypothetical protein
LSTGAAGYAYIGNATSSSFTTVTASALAVCETLRLDATGVVGTNSALTGLVSNHGSLRVDNGAALTLASPFVNSGVLFVEHASSSPDAAAISKVAARK